MNEDTKQCSKCGEWKSLDEFKTPGKQCHECIKAYMKAYMKAYYQNPYKKEVQRVHSMNHNAKKRNLPHTLTIEQWQHALNYFNGCCAVCGRQLNDMFGEFRAAADHWIPLISGIDNNPGTVATNIVPLCHGIGGCNNRKAHLLPQKWLKNKFSKKEGKRIAERIQTYFDSLETLETD